MCIYPFLFCVYVCVTEYLHSIGIIHRDMKCSNLLMQDNMIVKIADFGSSMYIDQVQNESLSKKKGATPHYMAPEMLISPTQQSYSVDIWQLGHIVAELAIAYPILYNYDITDIYELVSTKPESVLSMFFCCMTFIFAFKKNYN